MQSKQGTGNWHIKATAAAVQAALLVMVMLFTGGCVVKRTVNVPVPPKVLAAKVATVDEMMASLAHIEASIHTISSSSLKVSFTSGKLETGKLQAYRTAPGYILLKRPDQIRMNIQNPVTKTTLFELVSSGDPFSVWYPRENKLYLGNNSMKQIDLDGDSFTLRPRHIIEAILPRAIDLSSPGSSLVAEEARDSTAKYYVLSLVKADGGKILHPQRRLWIDRSVLAVTRQEIFDDEGRVVSEIAYSQLKPFGDVLLPLSIRIERPIDGYSLDMQFKEWRLNPALEESDFTFPAPEGALRVELKEKGRSE